MVHARMVIARDSMMAVMRIFHAFAHATREKLRSQIECFPVACAVGYVCCRTFVGTVGGATGRALGGTRRIAHTIDMGCPVRLALHKAVRADHGE
jgi:hypothetical protein